VAKLKGRIWEKIGEKSRGKKILQKITENRGKKSVGQNQRKHLRKNLGENIAKN